MLTKRRPFLDEYFRSVSWLELLKTLGERRPLIFIITNPKNQVREVVVKEESDLAYAERIKNMKPTDILNEKVVTFIAKENERETIVVEAETRPEKKEVAQETPAEKIVKEAVSEVAKQQGNEGEVTVGRWVEFEAPNGNIEQAHVSFITPDEQSFLLVRRDGSSVLVKAEKLLSLIPEVV